MKLSQIIKACLNPKILIGVGAMIVLAYLFLPRLAGLAWILLVLVCPLSMVIMMTTMQREQKQDDQRPKSTTAPDLEKNG